MRVYILSFSLSGAGEANFDSYENNPFQNPKQRQEQEVQTLLQKLSHEMIGLDSSFVGTLDKGARHFLFYRHICIYLLHIICKRLLRPHHHVTL